MRLSISFDQPRGTQSSTWWSRVGGAGLTFFLVKGLLWLCAPVLFALMR